MVTYSSGLCYSSIGEVKRPELVRKTLNPPTHMGTKSHIGNPLFLVSHRKSSVSGTTTRTHQLVPSRQCRERRRCKTMSAMRTSKLWWQGLQSNLADEALSSGAASSKGISPSISEDDNGSSQGDVKLSSLCINKTPLASFDDKDETFP